ncbi:TPA: hypothetical protein ACMDOB_003263, partial [Vibrio metschnikovii]
GSRLFLIAGSPVRSATDKESLAAMLGIFVSGKFIKSFGLCEESGMDPLDLFFGYLLEYRIQRLLYECCIKMIHQ